MFIREAEKEASASLMLGCLLGDHLLNMMECSAKWVGLLVWSFADFKYRDVQCNRLLDIYYTLLHLIVLKTTGHRQSNPESIHCAKLNTSDHNLNNTNYKFVKLPNVFLRFYVAIVHVYCWCFIEKNLQTERNYFSYEPFMTPGWCQILFPVTICC